MQRDSSRPNFDEAHATGPSFESKHRESEVRFRLMADSAPVMIWLAGLDKGCEWVNRPWLDFTGRTMQEELGFGWQRGVHAEDIERCIGIYNASFEARQPFSMDLRLRRHDGSYRWILVNGVPRHSPDGSFHGYTGSCVDIHERKELEERLAERTRALRIADRRKDEFIAMLSHDLRNPLGPITNAVAILRLMEGETPAIAPVRQIVERQLDQLRRVIGDMRDVTRITQAKVELLKEPLAVADMVQQAIYGVQAVIDSRGHQLQVHMPEQALTVLGDPMRLTQALGHLIGNSAKFTHTPGVIEVSVEADAAQVRIRVKDFGQGIHPDFLPQVFEPFAQENQARPRTNSGLGVGLTIAKRLVELHGGTLQAASDGPGQGAEFTMTLPLTPQDAVSADEAALSAADTRTRGAMLLA